MKLPVLYLVDSIVKNIGDHYTSLFTQNIVASFCSVFEKVFQKEKQTFFFTPGYTIFWLAQAYAITRNFPVPLNRKSQYIA